MTLLILAPMGVEARAARRGSRSARVVRAGYGPRRAAATAAAECASALEAAVAVAGVAGALVDDLPTGSIVVADSVLRADGSAVVARLDSAPIVAAALRQRGFRVRVGPIVSVEGLVKGASARSALAATGAIAVDLETASLAAVDWNRPLAVVRTISDTPHHHLLSAATVAGGWKALRSLRAASSVLQDWADGVGPRTVLLAGPRSFCAGVERAIQTVERCLERFGSPVYVRRQIVHNQHVVRDLEARGAVFVHELSEVPDGSRVVYSAHGVSRAVREDASRRGLEVVDATCPLVAKVHHEVQRFDKRGYQVVLIGHGGHDETEGTLGEIDGIQLVESVDDVQQVDIRDPERVAYVTQTTLSPDDVASVVEALSARFPSIAAPHAADICYATQNRQDAVRAIAGTCDLVLVIGSKNSSNAARLVEVAQRSGASSHLVEDDSELRLEWLRGATTVGITAAASTPPALVERVVETLGWLGPLTVEDRPVRTEQVNFPLPMEIR